MGVNVAAIVAASNRFAGLSNLGGFGTSSPEPRTEDQYLAEIDTWEAEARERLPEVLDKVAGWAWKGVVVRIRNKTETYLDQPEFHIHIAGPVDGLDKESDMPQLLDELPSPPRRWGPISNVSSIFGSGQSFSPYLPSFSPATFRKHGIVRFDNGGSVTLHFSLEELRPEAKWESDHDDFVLIVREEGVTEFHCTWQATVRGHNGIYEGELIVPVSDQVDDFTNWIESQLNSDNNLDADEDDEN